MTQMLRKSILKSDDYRIFDYCLAISRMICCTRIETRVTLAAKPVLSLENVTSS